MTPSRSFTLSHQYFIRASPKRVFAAISKPKMIVRWLCDRAEITPRAGGSYSLGWNDGPTHTGRIRAFARGKKIAFGWSWPGVSLRGTTFQLTVQPEGTGTLLRVEHIGIPRSANWADLYGGSEWGWTYFAMNLKALLEAGRDLRSKLDG